LLYHSVTITLELEAYVLASFAALLFAANVVQGFRQRQLLRCIARGLEIVFAAALLTGVLLGLAALYEATTLILLA
jgi:hypothetical protein